MVSQSPKTIAEKVANLVERLVGRPLRPVPVPVPVTGRRPRPDRRPTDWR